MKADFFMATSHIQDAAYMLSQGDFNHCDGSGPKAKSPLEQATYAKEALQKAIAELDADTARRKAEAA
jgi:hypothetical protein